MSNSITLYAYPSRSRAERILWLLKELEFEFDLVRLNPFKGGRVNPELLRLNPEGKVPILIHNGKVLLESLAIMEYLNSISKSASLVPFNIEINYDFRKKLHYGLTEIEPYLWLAEQAKGPLSRYYSWPDGVYEESISRVVKSCKVVKTFLVNGQILESGFSIADIYYYHVLTWAKQHGIEHHIEIENYLSQLEKRKAFPSEMYWKSKET